MKLKTIALFLAACCLAGGACAEQFRDDAQADWTLPVLAAPTDEPRQVPEEVSAYLNQETAAPAPQPADEGPIKDKESIRKAQQVLIELGYLKGSADGIAGKKTAAALQAFQADNHLSDTGELDGATFALLKDAMPASNKDVQQRLIELGYLRGTADGKWGKQSKAAMKVFQQLHELPATGTPDAASVARLMSDDVIKMPERLGQGDSGEAVEKLQQRLWQFAFLESAPDGEYGKTTVAAVKAFQQRLIDQELAQAYDIAATGEATPITQLFLFNSAFSTYLHDVAAGDAGDEAQRIQRRLTALGYMDLPVADALDEYAVQALDLFKAQAGVLTFGAADRATIDALFSANAPQAAHPAWHDIASGDKGLTVQAAQEALVYGGMLAALPENKYDKNMEKAVDRLHTHLATQKREEAALFENPAALSRQAVEALLGGLLDYASDVGAEGKKNSEAETLRVQRRLYALYYLPKLGVDGKFGRQTRDAIKLFQETNALEQTGVADRSTQEVLFSADAREKRFKHKVEVRLDEQRVHVYALNSHGEYDEVQNFICSTGLHDATPHGVFLDAHPLNRWHFFQKFYCWAQYSFIIEGDIMFHSVLYGSKNENSLTRSSVRNLGRPASHGCVRLQVEDAKWLFENCKRGEVVVIIK